MANPWDQDWSGQQASNGEANPWDQNWEQPKESSWSSRVGGEIASITNLIFNAPAFLASTLGRATVAPVEAIRGMTGNVQEGESPYAWERAEQKVGKLVAPIQDNISRIYAGLAEDGGQSQEQSTTNKWMHQISTGIEALADKAQNGIGLDPGATRWMADAAMLLFGDMAMRGVGKSAEVAGKKLAESPTEKAAERRRRENLGYEDPAMAEMLDAARKEELSKPLEYEPTQIEPELQEYRKQEEGLDYSEHTAETLSKNLVPEQQSLDTVSQKIKDLSGLDLEFIKGKVEGIRKPDADELLDITHEGKPVELTGQLKDAKGNRIGHVELVKHDEGGYEIRDINLNKEYQRKGIGSNLVQGLRDAGYDIKASKYQTEAGAAMHDTLSRMGGLGKKQGGAVLNPVEAASELIKAGGNLLERAKQIYDQHGPEAAKQFIIAYNEQKSQAQLQNTPKEVQAAVEDLVAQNLNNKTANNRIVYNNARKLSELASEDQRVKAASAIEQGTINSLSPEGQAVAKRYQDLVKDIGERAVDAGVLDGLLENYVTHAVDWKKADKSPTGELLDYLIGAKDRIGGGMSPKSKFGKERKYRTFEDLQKAIKDSGLELVTQDVAELYKIYANSMERAIENRKLIDNLKEVKNEFGDNVLQKITEDHPPPRGWEILDSPQFRGYAVQPELMPALKFALEQSDPNMFFQAVYNVSQLTKRLNVVGSFFHAKSLLEAFWSSTNPAHLVKEMSLGAWDKAMGTQHAGITKALDQFRNGGLGDKLDSFIRDGGLELAVPEDVLQGLMTRAGAAADGMISKYAPTNRILEKSLNKVEKYSLGLTDKLTWDYLHTGLKSSVALKYLEEARQRAIQNGEVFDEKAAMREISSNLNNTFGGLNWFEVARRSNTEMGKRMAMAAMNPAARRGLQVLLFAPDWTISTLRAFTTALPKSLNPAKWHPIEGIKGMRNPKTETDYARLYQMKTALTYLTILNGINYLTSGRPIWDNKDPTRIEFKDGTSMQAAKHAMEPYHWIADPDKTLSNKLGFIPRSGIVGFGGVEYASPTAPKMVNPSGINRAKAVASQALPFQITAANQAPEGEGLRRAALGTLGVPVYGSTKEQRRKRNQERRKEEVRLRKEWKQKAKERGWE